MNWTIIILVGLAALMLIVFLVRRNLKDEKSYEKQVNENHKKTKDEEDEMEVD